MEVVYSELEIAGRFGSGTVFAEKQVVAAGLSQLGRCSISPYVPFGCRRFAGEEGAWMLDIPDGLGYGAKSPELRESSRGAKAALAHQNGKKPFPFL